MASSASTSVVAATSSDAWTLDPSLGVYFHAPSSTYAIPDTLTGQWSYVPAKDFNHGQPSNWSRPNKPIEVEEGEVEDDVGWGGLMDEEEVQKLQRNVKRSQAPTINGRPAHNGEKGKKNPIYEYEDPVIHAYTRDRDLTPPTASREMPKDLLRLVVEKSEMLPVGGIAVIDAREGGVQIGRDRCEMGAQARVRLKEMEVSKTHAVVYWGKTPGSEDDESADEGWWVVDLGSTHGTFLTPEGGPKKRLSEPKHSSRPGSLSHNARLTIGSTTLIAHIHPSWPCESCQLNRENEIHLDEGNTSTPIGTPTTTTSAVELDDHMVALDSKQKRDNRDVRHRREMASLRDNLLKKNSQQSTHSSSSETNGDRTYVDRSAMRRKLHPTAPPMLAKRRSASPPTRHQEPVSAPPAAPSAFAAGLLASQGWTPGAGLGRNGDGRSQAIEVEVRTEKRGLGAQGAKAVVDVGEGNWKQRGKQRRWDEVER